MTGSDLCLRTMSLTAMGRRTGVGDRGQEAQGGGPAAKGQATDAEVSPKKVPEASESKRDGAQLQGPGLGPLDLLP